MKMPIYIKWQVKGSELEVGHDYMETPTYSTSYSTIVMHVWGKLILQNGKLCWTLLEAMFDVYMPLRLCLGPLGHVLCYWYS